MEIAISEVTNMSIKDYKVNPIVSNWDSFVLQEWKHLIIMYGWKLCKSSPSPISHQNVFWCSPSKGFWKLNFDGASRGNPVISGLGACIWDSHGSVVAITTSPLPKGTNNMVEAQALLAGLILAKRGNNYFLHIEGDSSIIINACIYRKLY